MAPDLEIDIKSMRTIVKSDLKLSPLKLNKRQHLTVFQRRKRAERTDILWNLLKSETQKVARFFRRKNIYSGGKVKFTKLQSACRTLRGRS